MHEQRLLPFLSSFPYAQLTNQRYRSIGLGISGYHHALAKRRIKWESEEHLEFMDKVFGLVDVVFSELTVVTDSVTVINDRESIASYNMSDTLIADAKMIGTTPAVFTLIGR